MARLKAYLLLIIVLIFTFSQFAIIINFLSNQDFITDNYCENTEKPELSCNGKCYLTKQLEEDEKQKGGNEVVHTEVLLILQFHAVELESEKVFKEPKKEYSDLLTKKTNSFSPDVFHPPIVTV